jgi:hypothetical protein
MVARSTYTNLQNYILCFLFCMRAKTPPNYEQQQYKKTLKFQLLITWIILSEYGFDFY